MSALSNVPRHAVLPLSAYDLEDLRKGAERLDQRWLQADCSGSSDRAEVLSAIAAGFGLDPGLGDNHANLYKALIGLRPDNSADQPGFVIVLRQLPGNGAFDQSERQALLDVFREAADYFYDHETAFRVFYSVASPSGAPAADQSSKALK